MVKGHLKEDRIGKITKVKKKKTFCIPRYAIDIGKKNKKQNYVSSLLAVCVNSLTMTSDRILQAAIQIIYAAQSFSSVKHLCHNNITV